MRSLGGVNPAFSGDEGHADPAVRHALAHQHDADGYLRAVASLGGARLLLPIVATGDEAGEGPDPDRHAEMAAVTLTSATGERALLAFTGLDALQTWQRDARPVPCTVDDLAATVEPSGASVLLIDVAGPHPLVVGGDVVAQLAQGRRLVALDDGGFGWMYLDAGT